MAYRRENFLKRVLEIQKIVKHELGKPSSEKYQRNGRRTLKSIFLSHVKPNYPMTYVTFCKYMGIPAAAELKKLKNDT